MKNILNRKIAFILCAAYMFFAVIPVGFAYEEDSAEGYADEEKVNQNINISLTVQERNNVAVEDYFFRRGIALEKGKLYSTDELCLKENGKELICNAEAQQYYDDGSICWLLVSGIVDLKPNEYKTLYLTNGSRRKSTITYKQNSTRMEITSGKIKMLIGPTGIESLKYNNSEQLNSPINLYVQKDGVLDYMGVSDILVLKHTDAYTKIRVRGNLCADISGEMYITFVEGSSRIQIDHRITVRDIFMIERTGLTVGREYSYSETGTVINKDFIDLGTMQLSSNDDTRFNGATCPAKNTGYVINEKTVDFAPLVNGGKYKYYDGFSRTTHLYIGFDHDEEVWAKTLNLPPAVTFDTQQYVRAGQILTTKMSAMHKELMESYKLGYERSVGRFNAGVVPYDINGETKTVGSYSTIPGELEYNFGLCYMQSGDPEIYRLIFDLAEVRADICCYRGRQEDCYGMLRGATNTDTYRFSMGHSYYGDQGGLYMAYVLTGDEYVFDTLKISLERTLPDMYLEKSYRGSRSVLYRSFTTEDPHTPMHIAADTAESRGMIRGRTFYLMAQLFQDDRYMQACRDLVQWAKNAQRPDGSYPQFMNQNGRRSFDSVTGEEIVKDYIMLYGIRGISQILDFEEDPTVLEIIKKVSDYLCTSREKFGPMMIMPNSDKEIYNLNDGGSRGPSPMTTMLAVDVLVTAFEHTGSERYLKTLLDFFRVHLCCEMGGAAPEEFTEKGNNSNIRPVVAEALRSTSLFRFSDNLYKIVDDNRQKLIDMGYEDITMLFNDDSCDGGKAYSINHKFPGITHNIYQSGGQKALFLSNNCSDTSDTPFEKDVEVLFKENRLWDGAENYISDNTSVTLKKYMMQTDTINAIQRPVYIDQFAGNAKAEFNEYNEEKISILFSGDFDIALRIKDGRFRIEDGQGYNIDLSSRSGGVLVTVTKGGNYIAKNGEINIKFNDMAQPLDIVGTDVIKEAGLGEYEVDAPLNGNVLKELVLKKLGKDISLASAQPTWGEFAPVLMSAVAEKRPEIINAFNLHMKYDVKDISTANDDEAVLYGAMALSVLYDGDELSQDVYLPKESLLGTTVTWSSSREDILNGEGILNREVVDCDSVTLTATVIRGNSQATRNFVIPLKQKASTSSPGAPGFGADTTLNLIPHYNEFEITFVATPLADGIDACISFTSSDVSVRSNADVPFIVRFNPSGVIDMMDKSGYVSDSQITYTANTPYKFRIVMRPDKLTYDAYVTPAGGEEMLIGKDCAARLSAQLVDRIDVMYTWASKIDSYKTEDISLVGNPKDAPVGNGFYDENGLVFGDYRTKLSTMLPRIAQSGKLINWAQAGNYRSDIGNSITLQLGIESESSRAYTLVDILKLVSLLDSDVTENTNVTVKTLSRVLTAIK